MTGPLIGTPPYMSPEPFVNDDVCACLLRGAHAESLRLVEVNGVARARTTARNPRVDG